MALTNEQIICDIYDNVGLNTSTPENHDSLPVELDNDKDLIVDDKDICSNSLNEDMKSLYGCKSIFEDTFQICMSFINPT